MDTSYPDGASLPSDRYSEVRDALGDYAEAVTAAWRHPSYTPASYGSGSPLKTLVTRADGAAPVTLPRTGWLVRGGQDVVVEEVERERPADPLPTVHSALIRADAEWRTYPPLTEEEKATRQDVKDAEARVIEALAEIPSLVERTYDISGFKNHDIQGIRDLIRSDAADASKVEPGQATLYDTRRRFGLGWTLSPYLVEGLEQAGLDPEDPGAFDDWEPVLDHVVERLRRLETRETWTYEFVALLNAPLVDHPGPVHLADAAMDGQPIAITVEAVPDELLNRLAYRSYNFTGVGPGLATAPINAALRYRATIPIEAPMSEYVGALASAADLFTRVVDALRLVRHDDLGIVGVESFSVEPKAPTIRYHYDVGHNPTYASVVPRRSYFFVESAVPLSDEDLATVREVLPAYLDGSHRVEGLDVAMRRFRDSRDRYRPRDPESLLDLTVALEALLLTGSERTELSYRLGIRAARLVGQTLEGRLSLFDIVRDLYAVRSKLAHGSALGTMKAKDASKVKTALNIGPLIFKDIVLQFLRGDGPSGLTNDKLTGWWRAVELGGEPGLEPAGPDDG